MVMDMLFLKDTTQQGQVDKYELKKFFVNDLKIVSTSEYEI